MLAAGAAKDRETAPIERQQIEGSSAGGRHEMHRLRDHGAGREELTCKSVEAGCHLAMLSLGCV